MNFAHKVKMNLQCRGNSIVAPVTAMQGDSGRILELALLDGQTPWEPPEGARVQVGYTRADGTPWTYDKLPNGDDAGSIEGNVVRVTIAPEVLSKPGKIPMAVTLISGDTQISTFPVMLQVTARPGYGGGEIDPGGTAPTYTVEVEVT